MRERPPDLPDFNRPPLVEVALGVQFEPLPQMRQGHVGLFWTEIHDQYPNARDLQPLDPTGEAFDGETPMFTFQISDAPPLHRAWFLSEDQTRLVQVQSDRLIHNWRQVQAEPYPRFEMLYETFAERFEQFETVLSRAGVPRPVCQQVEVTYINWITTGTLADFFLPTQSHPLGLESIADADEEGMNIRYPVADEGRPIGRLYVQVGNAVRSALGQSPERGFLVSLTFRAPLPVPTEASSVEEAMYLGRNAIVRVFTALTKPNWHETWERTT